MEDLSEVASQLLVEDLLPVLGDEDDVILALPPSVAQTAIVFHCGLLVKSLGGSLIRSPQEDLRKFNFWHALRFP